MSLLIIISLLPAVYRYMKFIEILKKYFLVQDTDSVQLVSVCAWCPKDIYPTLMSNQEYTHGLCKKHYRQLHIRKRHLVSQFIYRTTLLSINQYYLKKREHPYKDIIEHSKKFITTIKMQFELLNRINSSE